MWSRHEKIFYSPRYDFMIKKLFLNFCLLWKIPNVITYIVENLGHKLINVFFFSMQNAQMQWWYHWILDFCKKMVLFSLFFLEKKRGPKWILLTQMYPSFDPLFCHLTTFHDHGFSKRYNNKVELYEPIWTQIPHYEPTNKAKLDHYTLGYFWAPT